MPAIPEEGSSFEQPPLGTHTAICTRIVDLGTQQNTYQGETTHTHQVALFWETTAELTSKGEPFQMVRFYTWSMSPKSNLRKDLESWRGKAFTKEEFGKFDIKNVLGQHCQVIIGNSETGKTKVAGIAGWPKGMPKPRPSTAPFMVWLSPDEFEEDSFDALTDFWKDKIRSSPEYQALRNPNPVTTKGSVTQQLTDDLDDSIPFVTREGIW